MAQQESTTTRYAPREKHWVKTYTVVQKASWWPSLFSRRRCFLGSIIGMNGYTKVNCPLRCAKQRPRNSSRLWGVFIAVAGKEIAYACNWSRRVQGGPGAEGSSTVRASDVRWVRHFGRVISAALEDLPAQSSEYSHYSFLGSAPRGRLLSKIARIGDRQGTTKK